MAKLHVSKCNSDRELPGCIYDKGTANLPAGARRGAWAPVPEFDVAPGPDMPDIVGVARQVSADDLAAQGDRLSRGKVAVTLTGARQAP